MEFIGTVVLCGQAFEVYGPPGAFPAIAKGVDELRGGDRAAFGPEFRLVPLGGEPPAEYAGIRPWRYRG